MPEVTFAPSAEDFEPGAEPDFAALEDTGADDGDQDNDGADDDVGTVEAPPAKAEKPAAQSADDEARQHGWVPRAEWKGPPGKWKPAADFLAIMNESAPVLKERMKAMREDYDQRFKRLESQTQKALEAQRKTLEADYRAQISAAKAAGDVDEVERLASEGPPQIEEAPPVEVTAFVERNPWFLQDQDMHRIAVGIEEKLAKSDPAMSLGDRLIETERRLSVIYPDLIKAPAKGNGSVRTLTPPTANEGVRLAPRKSAVDKLSKQERSMGAMFVAQGAYKNLEEYAADLEQDTFVIGKKAKA